MKKIQNDNFRFPEAAIGGVLAKSVLKNKFSKSYQVKLIVKKPRKVLMKKFSFSNIAGS